MRMRKLPALLRVTFALPTTLALGSAPATLSGTEDRAAAVVRALMDQDRAVATVGYRLATANADLCAEDMIESGMLIETLGQYSADYRSAAAAVLGLSNRPTVALVVPESPADRAGIRAGDALIDADSQPFEIRPPMSGAGDFGSVEAAMTLLDRALADGKATLTVRRGDRNIVIGVSGARACRARFQLLPGNDLDAVADGTWVQISTRAAEFADTPNKLAAILAHELAHNILGHRKAKAKIQRAQELAADRLMPWLMARAGYDPGAAVALWRQFKAAKVGGLIPDSTHPGWGARLRAVEAERVRIAFQPLNGGKIIPPASLNQR
jgi:hypothetical protein